MNNDNETPQKLFFFIIYVHIIILYVQSMDNEYIIFATNTVLEEMSKPVSLKDSFVYKQYFLNYILFLTLGKILIIIIILHLLQILLQNSKKTF